MSLPRISLNVAGLVLLGFGAYFLYEPAQVARLLGVPAPPPELRAELAAVYGGLQLGLGAFFLVAARRGRWVLPGLAAQICAFLGLAIGRGLGMLTQGARTPLLVYLLALELGGALLGLLGFRRARQLMATNATRTYW